MCDLNQNMKQKKQKKTEKKQKKNIAKQTLGNGYTVGFKSFMKLHQFCFCVYQHFHEFFSFGHFLIYIRQIFVVKLRGCIKKILNLEPFANIFSIGIVISVKKSKQISLLG